MVWKTSLCLLLSVQCMVISMAAIIQPPCIVTDVGNGLEEEQCGDLSVLRYKNGTVISTERELFENENLWILELDNDETACYRLDKSEFPNGFQYSEYDKDEAAEEADETQSELVRMFVPRCQGRTIYNLRGETEDDNRSKRRARICYRCLRLIYRNRITRRIVRIRVFCYRRICRTSA